MPTCWYSICSLVTWESSYSSSVLSSLSLSGCVLLSCSFQFLRLPSSWHKLTACHARSPAVATFVLTDSRENPEPHFVVSMGGITYNNCVHTMDTFLEEHSGVNFMGCFWKQTLWCTSSLAAHTTFYHTASPLHRDALPSPSSEVHLYTTFGQNHCSQMLTCGDEQGGCFLHVLSVRLHIFSAPHK